MPTTSLTPYMRSRRQDPREQLALMMMQQNARPVSTIGQGASSLANMIAAGMAGGALKQRRLEGTRKAIQELRTSGGLSEKAGKLVSGLEKAGDEHSLELAEMIALSDATRTPSYSHLKSVPGVGLVDMRTSQVVMASGETAAAGRIATDVEAARRRIKEFAASTPAGKTPLEHIKNVIEAPLGSLTPKDQIVAQDIRRAYDAARGGDKDLPEFEAFLNRQVPPPATPGRVSAGPETRAPTPEEPGVLEGIKNFFSPFPAQPSGTSPLPRGTPEPARIAPALPPRSDFPSGIETNVGEGPTAGERFMAALTPESRQAARTVAEGFNVQGRPAQALNEIGTVIGQGAREIGSRVSAAARELATMMGLGASPGTVAAGETSADLPDAAPVGPSLPADEANWMVPNMVPQDRAPAGGEGGMRGTLPPRTGEREEAPEPTQADRDILDFSPGMKPADLIPGKTYKATNGIKAKWDGKRFVATK